MTDRIESLRAAVQERQCDAFLSFAPPDNQYLSGFTGSTSVIIVTPAQAVFLNDFRYTEQVSNEVQGYETAEVRGNLAHRAGERLCELGVKNVCFEPAAMTVAQLNYVKEKYDGALTPADGVVGKLRQRKDQTELDAIRDASELAEGAMLDIVAELKEGVTESEAAALLEYEFKKRGAAGVSFEPIVLFGAHSSLPHGVPGDRRLQKGDVVLVDCGCRKGGYCSDLTRTFVFGTIAQSWFQEIYDLTHQAQAAALEAVTSGTGCRDVDAVARTIITDGGYGDYFGHGLGHGVGIEVHEGPRLNPESEATLQAGMVITIEPGIYLPGKGGVRIEDLVVVTDSGCDIFTTSSKTLRVLET